MNASGLDMIMKLSTNMFSSPATEEWFNNLTHNLLWKHFRLANDFEHFMKQHGILFVCCVTKIWRYFCWYHVVSYGWFACTIMFNTLWPRQNGRHFADNTFKRIFLKNVRISIKISLNFVQKSPINNKPALFQIMAWRRPGDKPLSEAIIVSLLAHICVARPRWVNEFQ